MPFYRSLNHRGELFELLPIFDELRVGHWYYFATIGPLIASKSAVFVLKSVFGQYAEALDNG